MRLASQFIDCGYRVFAAVRKPTKAVHLSDVQDVGDGQGAVCESSRF